MRELSEELVAMAEEQFTSQAPLAELMDRDPAFAEWIQRAVTSRVPLPLAVWDQGEAPAELLKAYELLDRHDTRLASIIEDSGWPGRSRVGEDGADAAWAIAQHADRHQTVRRGWVPLLEEAASLREADPRHFARLADRVAMVDGQSQLFGSYATLGSNGEIVWDPPAEGTLGDVDRRRWAIGLPPLLEDLAEPPDAAPYRYMRKTPAFAWPPPLADET